MKSLFLAAIVLITFTFSGLAQTPDEPGIIVLGVAQDGGYPHLGCEKECCNYAWENPSAKRFVASLALIDPSSGKWFLFEATPDIREQLRLFREITNGEYNYLPDAIFISHAHIGHYTGLMEFGREVMNTSGIEVYTLPGMKHFLENNGPWSQLVDLNNISIKEVQIDGIVSPSENISVKFFTVPHRDEFSETAGFTINTDSKSYLFIPDIDKWDRWNISIEKMVEESDFAFIDGTFYNINELPGRDINQIPHPFIYETIKLFENQPLSLRNKIYFIHLNHSNPLLRSSSDPHFINSGMNLAIQGVYY
jgi:pyrroloquinoline quinone biosynthesis protein B